MKKIFLLTEGQRRELKKHLPDIPKNEIKQLLKKNKIVLKGFNLNDLIEGMRVEFEHGKINKKFNVTNDHLEQTMKIALAHLYEKPKYYKLLKKYVE